MYDVNRATWNLRLGLIGLTAVSVSLPMAWISLAKVLIFVCALLVLVNQIRARRSDSALGRMWTPWAIAMLLVCSAGSGLWTAADLPVALVTFVKHSKLLEIVLLISLIRTATEARVAVTAFAFGQAFMLLSSWLMVFSMFLFVSLSLAKRHVEVLRRTAAGERRVANRGYRAEDAGLTMGLGLATATVSPLILV
ncbi:MAG TPA: hypothetical protein PLL01_16655, partial [Rhodoferax sp.]|nr:hypothetical protein [Rhodoferax sp.]